MPRGDREDAGTAVLRSEVGTPERLRKYIQDDLTKWTAFGKDVKLTD